MTEIDKLIEAVESGWWYGDTTAFFEHREHMNCYKAYHGSLDAAKALHEALLSWDYWINWFDLDGVVQIKNPEDDVFDGKSTSNPARAWLLAVLKAYRSLQ